MLSEQQIIELRAVFQTQNHILQQIDARVLALEAEFADQKEDLQELQQIMAELEASVDLLEADDLNDFKPDKISQIYECRRAAVADELALLHD